MLEPIILDGRQFTSTKPDSTAQRGYIIDHLRLAGAVEIMNDLDGKTRTEEQRAEELLTHILLSAQKHHILAGCLIEERKVWSRAEADANAARFAAITDDEDKLVLGRLMAQFVVALCSSASAPESDALRRFQEFDVREQEFVN